MSSYWHQMYRRPAATERVEVLNGEVRFETLLAKKDLKEGDRKFAESMSTQLKERGDLSTKQVQCLERLEQRYSPESVLKRERWAQSYKAEYRPTAILAATYYATTQYFRDLSLSILTNEDFVPTRRQYDAMTQNKYAQKAIKVATTDSEFPVGSLCKVRNRRDTNILHHHRDQLALVLKTHRDGLYGSSTVLVNGETVKYEDRFLKQLSRKNNKKN